MISDVFGLNTVYERQTEDTWTEDPNFGYFGGGTGPSVPGRACTIDRLDFSNETVSAPGNDLRQARNYLAAVSNSNYGYYVGGEDTDSQAQCTIDRLDFSNETVSAPPSKLAERISYSAAVSNSNYGYFGAGVGFKCTIQRLDFSDETVSISAANLLGDRYNHTAVSSNSYGYFAGGYGLSSHLCTIDRLDFSTESVNSLSSTLEEGKIEFSAVSSNSYGYFAGGSNPTQFSMCTIERLDFSSETVSNPPANLLRYDYLLTAVSSNSYGYFTHPSGTPCTMERLDFSTETVVAPGDYFLTQRRDSLAALSSGASGSTIRHLRKTSSTDIDGKPISNSYGYFAGGSQVPISGSSWVNTIDRLDFSTETRSSPSDRLIERKRGMVALSSSNYGYIAGGWLHFQSSPAYLCTIERLDFSTETLEAPGTYQLTSKRVSSGTVSNFNYGYFGGGSDDTAPPYLVCIIDRLDFSTETIQYPVIGHLTEGRSSLAAVSNSNYGYFGGGSLGGGNISCTIDRLDFSNETVDVPGTLDHLTDSRSSLTSVYNSNYGYFAGGQVPGVVCTIERLDFSTETVLEPGIQLIEARYNLAAVSNNSYGYFGGGYGPSWVCTIDRLDFSSETMQYPVTAEQLSEARNDLAGLSN